MTDVLAPPIAASVTVDRPRVGFLGVGWIGRHRMEAVLATGAVEAVGLADPSPEMLAEGLRLAPMATAVDDLDSLLDLNLDGLVIATPSALHARQAIRALERGVAVFCQKPLGRSTAEVSAVVEAARQADRLLAVDLSYRCTEGMKQIREVVRSDALGKVFAVDLVFHNAYGPDKPWFYNPELSGGGCVMDLGVHLVDIALWSLDFPEVATVSSVLLAGGEPLAKGVGRVEDYATATLTLKGGAVVRLACSWRLQAGAPAVISASFYGQRGGAAFENIDGSFYDFTADLLEGTSRRRIVEPPDAWGGRAATDWATGLRGGAGFDPAAERLVDVARVLDRIYGR